MRKNIKKLLVFAALLTGMLLLCAGALASDTLSFNTDIQPPSLTGPASVRVSINIVNTGDGSPISVTLYDPAGNVVTGFGSGGTANLAPSASAAYTGNWTVTQQQLDAGKITYSARYTVTDENGNSMPATRPIGLNITYNAAKAQLNIVRTIEPGSIVTQGSTVKIRYTIVNVGTIDVKNISITDPDIIDTPATLASLAVGETAEVSYQYTAGTTSKRTHAEFTFQYENGNKTETSKPKQIDPPATIEVTVPNLIVQLAGRQIVNAGDKVDLTYVITNKSDLTYQQIKISDKLLGDIDTNLTIGPGKSHQGTKSITVNKTETYQLTLTGVDSTGNDIIFLSNELTIQTTDTLTDQVTAALTPANLNIAIEADRDVIYTEPSDIMFRVQVTNNGASAAEKVAIGTAGHYGKKIMEIDRIEPTETVEFILPLSATMGGLYEFTATTKDSDGEDKTFNSNQVRVVYQAPAPTPTPQPTPTEVPPTEPPATEPPDPGWVDPNQSGTPSETEGGSLGRTLLYIFGGLLILGILAVVAAMFLDSRRKGGGPRGPSGGGGGNYAGPVKVIDTIQRSPHRDYTRAPKKAPTNGGGTRGARTQSNIPDNMPEDDGGYGQPYASSMEDTGGYRRVRAEEPSIPEETAYDSYDEGDAAYDAAARYRRPDAAPASQTAWEDDGEPYAAPASAPQAAADDSLGDTNVYGNEYLSRIRGEKPEDGFDKILEDAAKPTLSEEEASLLNGSTGQYRLSRRTAASVRAPETRNARKPIEDPETFARKQRAARAAKEADDTSFYDDDET